VTSIVKGVFSNQKPSKGVKRTIYMQQQKQKSIRKRSVLTLLKLVVCRGSEQRILLDGKRVEDREERERAETDMRLETGGLRSLSSRGKRETRFGVDATVRGGAFWFCVAEAWKRDELGGVRGHGRMN
jgi:hypothetical protein